LRNVLSRRVPVIGAREIYKVAMRLLKRNGLGTADIHHWAVHPGGTVVLDRIARQFGIEQDVLMPSREMFAEYGNMSSPSVLFCLKEILEKTPPAPSDLGLMLTFGAGFTASAALVEFGDGR
jgi:alpha-pyrone synthase